MGLKKFKKVTHGRRFKLVNHFEETTFEIRTILREFSNSIEKTCKNKSSNKQNTSKLKNIHTISNIIDNSMNFIDRLIIWIQSRFRLCKNSNNKSYVRHWIIDSSFKFNYGYIARSCFGNGDKTGDKEEVSFHLLSSMLNVFGFVIYCKQIFSLSILGASLNDRRKFVL